MSWFLDVVIAAILLVAILAQHQDLVDTRHRLDDLGAANMRLHRQLLDLRRRLLPLPEERRTSSGWNYPKEYS